MSLTHTFHFLSGLFQGVIYGVLACVVIVGVIRFKQHVTNSTRHWQKESTKGGKRIRVTATTEEKAQ